MTKISDFYEKRHAIQNKRGSWYCDDSITLLNKVSQYYIMLKKEKNKPQMNNRFHREKNKRIVIF